MVDFNEENPNYDAREEDHDDLRSDNDKRSEDSEQADV
jgi:hypothetical protein